MRRVPGVVIAGLALLLAAACGDDAGNGDDGATGTPSASAPAAAPGGEARSTEEVCAEAQQLFDDLDQEGNQVRDDLFEAADSGDTAALEQAQADYLGFVGEFTTELRSLAGSAEDPAVGDTLEAFATEFEAVANQVAEDPQERENVDTSTLDTAIAQAAGYCQ